jgi:hypothetical protein
MSRAEAREWVELLFGLPVDRLERADESLANLDLSQQDFFNVTAGGVSSGLQPVAC